ncbi:Gamma-glutamylcyclotransferase, AIG2-like [Quillaja saponaria]|uniref:Gamma-glutamylcyclotransferase family protein n=1 Tax=Quillaja saponaria TaxID=32244 RepID=A0AAD7L1J9_QUISA|nr:Gamma-glutamylcyclotransferase, AIG2-like [Quillaja saponaria]
MVAEDARGGGERDRNSFLIFTYGTLKRGFFNHTLMQDLIHNGHAAFVGSYLTAEKYPLVYGPYWVPFLINLLGSGNRVEGELYTVSTRGLVQIDELEGTSRGHYERLPIKLVPQDVGNDAVSNVDDDDDELQTCAEAYYAHKSYAMELWNKDGKRGFCVYSNKEARGYVKRKDRPQNLTFLDQIRLFVSSESG